MKNPVEMEKNENDMMKEKSTDFQKTLHDKTILIRT